MLKNCMHSLKFYIDICKLQITQMMHQLMYNCFPSAFTKLDNKYTYNIRHFQEKISYQKKSLAYLGLSYIQDFRDPI